MSQQPSNRRRVTAGAPNRQVSSSPRVSACTRSKKMTVNQPSLAVDAQSIENASNNSSSSSPSSSSSSFAVALTAARTDAPLASSSSVSTSVSSSRHSSNGAHASASASLKSSSSAFTSIPSSVCHLQKGDEPTDEDRRLAKPLIDAMKRKYGSDLSVALQPPSKAAADGELEWDSDSESKEQQERMHDADEAELDRQNKDSSLSTETILSPVSGPYSTSTSPTGVSSHATKVVTEVLADSTLELAILDDDIEEEKADVSSVLSDASVDELDDDGHDEDDDGGEYEDDVDMEDDAHATPVSSVNSDPSASNQKPKKLKTSSASTSSSSIAYSSSSSSSSAVLAASARAALVSRKPSSSSVSSSSASAVPLRMNTPKCMRPAGSSSKRRHGDMAQDTPARDRVVLRRLSQLRRSNDSTWAVLDGIDPLQLSQQASASRRLFDEAPTNDAEDLCSTPKVSEGEALRGPRDRFIWSSRPLLCHILTCCTVEEILRCRRVSRVLHLASCSKPAWRCSTLVIEDERVMQRSLSNVSSLMGLRSLTLNGQYHCEITDSAMMQFANISTLTSLQIANSVFAHDLFQTVITKQLPHLNTLTLKNNLAMTDAGMNLMTANKEFASRIVHLDLTKYRGLTSVKHFSAFTRLLSLNLRGCRGLREETLSGLTSLRLLELDISFIQLPPTAYSLLLQPESALRLTLERLSVVGVETLTDHAVHAIAECPSLRYLNVSSCEALTDQAFAQWSMHGSAVYSIESLCMDLCRKLTGNTLRQIADTISQSQLMQKHDDMQLLDGTGFIVESDVEAATAEARAQAPENDEKSDELASSGDAAAATLMSTPSGRFSDSEDGEDGDSPSLSLHSSSLECQENCRMRHNSMTGFGLLAWQKLRSISVRHCRGVDNASKTVLAAVISNIFISQ